MNRFSALIVTGGLIGSAALYFKYVNGKVAKSELSAGKRLKEVKQELEDLKESIYRKRILMIKIAAVSTAAIYLSIRLRAFHEYATSPSKRIK